MSSSTFWRIHLFGGLRLVRGSEEITRFRSQKFGALLAYLALFPHRLHSREELVDLLWPDAEMEVGRGNLRAALASLRRQLEPPGDPAGSVFIADGRTHLHLNREAIHSDVADFETALAAAARTTGDEAARHLSAAVAQYAGALLPGNYEAWALSERDRFAEAYLRALGQLVAWKEQTGDADAALDYARRAVSADPLREDSHAAVIRLLMECGQAAAAKRQLEELSRLLKENFDTEPEPRTRALTEKTVHTPRPRAAARVTAPDVIAPVAVAIRLEQTLSRDTAPKNFPLTVTRFFGREEEIEALREQLRDLALRLVTITGPGGSGKTRVSTETAKGMREEFRGGIWFVPLVDVREADRVPEALAAALGIVRGGAQTVPIQTQVIRFLRSASEDGRVLLLLDNFEQLAESASGIVADLLTQVPALCCLVTSRQRLRIDGEAEFPLLPLPVPEHLGTPERLLEFSSVQLFVNRSQAARPDFQLTSRNIAAVTSLCAQLEGMPLAIELAAAWMGVLSPAQMLLRMTRRLDVLVSRRRDVSPRHRTLRAAIESSAALLAPEIRDFFAALSVFRGGWTLEAAEAVCDKESALEYLTELADHSLVVRVSDRFTETENEDESPVRFRMLETLREFAEELQAERPEEEASRLQERHADWASGLAASAAPFLTGSEQAIWMHRLQADHDNLRAALGYLLQHDIEEELLLATNLFRFWQARGPITEAHAWLEQGLDRDKAGGIPFASPRIRAQALECAGTLAWYRSDLTGARARLNESIALYRSLSDGIGVASAINSFAGMYSIANDHDSARALLEEGLAEMAALSGETAAAGRQILLEALTRDAAIRNDRPTIERYGDEWLQLARATGDNHVIAAALTWNSFAAINAEEYNRARALLNESLLIAREVNEALYVCSALWGLGYIALFEGRPAEAGALERDAMRTIAGLTGYDFSVVHIITAIAMAALADGQPEHAARLLGAGETLRRNLGYPLAPVLVKVNIDDIIAKTRAALGDLPFKNAFSLGAALPFDQAIQKAVQDWG